VAPCLLIFEAENGVLSRIVQPGFQADKAAWIAIFQMGNACDSKKWIYFGLMKIIDIAGRPAITIFLINAI
jgi:hypothetical protein